MLKSKSAKITELYVGERLDIAAAALFKELSRKKIKSIIDAGGAYINKKRILIAKTQLKIGDKIEIFWEEHKINNSDLQIQDFKINNTIGTIISKDTLIFENSNFFIINKPAGIASQSTLSSSKDTIFYALNAFDSNKYNVDKMFLVHRLDKDTSGLMVIAKNKDTQNKFEQLFKDKNVEKTYQALTFFAPAKSEGKISFPIAKDNSRKNCYFAVINPNSRVKDVKQAETFYNVEKVFGKNEVSLINCKPKTGRTHQIRVHLAAVGCPLLGDKTYSQNIHGHRFLQIALRHMLHASHLLFEMDGEKFDFNVSLPEDFRRIIKIVEGKQ
ncbi:RluA family pseudouridine synthase [Fluviispira multicolorata]|uniref:Pseudouridine synthase n=1 Tax=Fluviispira multicolorata TaxID=2654512 RepID=A0A833JF77_9BACT|nr:RluA family pseudouridine synthase [Fluviispira multicolorata]KAB8030839.1 RluA family pseudouridine synthase [Fluviispira multicolorata]